MPHSHTFHSNKPASFSSIVRAIRNSDRWLLAILALAVLSCSQSVLGQDVQYAQDSVDQSKRSGLTVDPASLGMTFQLPLGDYNGRAGTSQPIVLQNSSKVWRLEYGGHTGLNPNVNGWVYPVYAQLGGWTASPAPPGLQDTSMTMKFNSDGTPDCAICGPPHSYTYIVYRIQRACQTGPAMSCARTIPRCSLT